MNITDYDYYVLNMADQPERLAEFQYGYAAGIPEATVMNGIAPEELTPPEWWQHSLAMNSNRVNFVHLLNSIAGGICPAVIFEDDCCFCDDFATLFSAFLSELPSSYSIFNLGHYPAVKALYPPQQISQNCMRLKYGWNTHAIGITPEAAAVASNWIDSGPWGGNHVTDRRIAQLYLRPEFEVYGPLPHLCGQRKAVSTLGDFTRPVDDYFNCYEYYDLTGTLVRADAVEEESPDEATE